MEVSQGEIRPSFAFGRQRRRRRVRRPASMRVLVTDCRVGGLGVRRFACDVTSDETLLRLDNMRGALAPEGEVSGVLRYDRFKRRLAGEVNSRFDPHLVLPVVENMGSTFLPQLIRRFEFKGGAPGFETTFTRQFGERPRLELVSKFWARNCTYKGVELLRADGEVTTDVSETNRVAHVSPILVVRREGNVHGRFTVDGVARTVTFEGVSEIDPKALARMIARFDEALLERFRFDGRVRIAAHGTVSSVDRRERDLAGSVTGTRIGVGSFLTDSCSFTVQISGLTNTLEEIEGRMYGGDLTGRFQFVTPYGTETNVAYSVQGALRGADFQRVAVEVMGLGDKDYSGRLTARAALQGMTGRGQGRTVRGEGSIRIKDGRVFLLPVFGGLSVMLTRIIPGLDFVLRQSDAKAELKIDSGKVHTDKVLIEGGVLSLAGSGDLHFNRDVAFDVQVTLMKEHTLVAKIIRTLTYPISKFFEFRLYGSLDDPQWEPFRFPAGLLERLGLKTRRGTEE